MRRDEGCGDGIDDDGRGPAVDGTAVDGTGEGAAVVGKGEGSLVGVSVGGGDMVGKNVPPGSWSVKSSEKSQTSVLRPQTRNLCRPVVPPGSRSSMTGSALPTHSQGSPSLDASSLHLKK